MTHQDRQMRDAGQGRDAYGHLIDLIRTGALLPGDRLTETDIAARLGISRTPVREAIRALEGDGLVVHVPRAGATVRTLSPSEVTELYEMRVVLEGTAARLAARVAADVEIAEMEAINAEMVGAGVDAAQSYRLNRDFHRALLDSARNRFLSEAVAGLEKTLLILGPSTLQLSARAEEAQREHAEIVACLRARDGDRAEKLMRAHIEAAHAARLRQLRHAGRPETGGDLM